ncbi:hypothetical protein IMG5_020520, partial [Ichthyophthirius multifiliis]
VNFHYSRESNQLISQIFSYKTIKKITIKNLLQQISDEQYEINADYSVQGRSNEEIGIKHIDNTKENLNLQNFKIGSRKFWNSHQQELLDLLDQLEKSILSKMQKLQNDEIAAAVALAELKAKIMKENEEMQSELEIQIKNEKELRNKILFQQKLQQECKKQLDEINKRIEQSKKELEEQRIWFQKKINEIIQEIELYKQVIKEYINNVFSNENDFHKRTDDYIDDSQYQYEGYNQRQIDNIGFLTD